MILGASATQVPLIQCAKKMGVYTCVASIAGHYPGLKIADQSFIVSTTDKEAILDICQREHIDGICTTGTDVAVRSIGYVNTKLGLSGITDDSSKKVTDKAEMKKAMCRYGVRTAEFRVAYSLDDAYRYANEIGYPVMLKTVDQAASKGISKVDNATEIEQAYSYALKWTDKIISLLKKLCLAKKSVWMDMWIKMALVPSFCTTK